MTNADDVKGRVKQAVGDLTDDDRMKHEGMADRAAGSVKDAIDGAKEKAEQVVDAIKDKAHDLLDKD